MSILREDYCYQCMLVPESKFDNENYYYYETVPLNSHSTTNHTDSNERSTYESSEKNYFDYLTFMDFSKSDDKIKELESPKLMIQKSIFQEFSKKAKKLFMTYRREKTKKIPAMVCDNEGCGMAFRHKWIFEKHLSSHLTCKFYKCLEIGCHKLYKSKENLNLHKQNIHEGIKPYECLYCSLRFSHRNGKTYHERKMHNNYLPHICNVYKCTKAFASKSALNYHLTNQHTK